MKRIMVVSGSRSEYGLLKPVINAIRSHDELELSLVITGSHLSDQFGESINEILNDGIPIAYRLKLPMWDDSNYGMARLLGEGVIKISEILKESAPSILLVLGDRVEVLAAVISSFYMNIPIAHIHGGDSSIGGHLDDSVRHAITKFSHVHFAASAFSGERIYKMGEEEWRINVVGAPGLDTILKGNILKPDVVAAKFGLDLNKPIILMVQNPLTTEVKEAPAQIRETLIAVAELGYQTVIIYPNADAGGREMIKVIDEYKYLPHIQTHKNIPHEHYLGLLNITSALIGNSSSGIIEAPSFKLPVVDIGSRQQGRERAGNVIDADYDSNQIKDAIEKALYDEKFKEMVKGCTNPYGDGRASERILNILTVLKIDKKLLQKKLRY